MKLKNILQLVGAGVTGGFLALKIRRPKNSYDDFLRLYGALTADFINQFRSAFLQTMLPAVEPELHPQLDQLLDRPSTFLEQLRFLQRHLPLFDELVVKSLRRFYRLREEGLIASLVHRKIPHSEDQTFQVAVDQIFYDLEQSFAKAMKVNSPSSDRAELGFLENEELTLVDKVDKFREWMPGLGPVLFDALSRFDERLSKPGLPE